MAGKKSRKTVRLIALIIFACALIFFFIGFYNIFNREDPRLPDCNPNTIWECQECDLYCIVDKNGHSFGAFNPNGESIYVEFGWGTTSFVIAETPVDEMGLVISHPSYDGNRLVESRIDTIKKDVITVTTEPENIYFDFRLWETDEPVTLTFVCQGRIPEVDLYNGVDPIRRMEVIQ